MRSPRPRGSSDAPFLIGLIALAAVGALGWVVIRRRGEIAVLRARHAAVKGDAESAYVELDRAWGQLADRATATVEDLNREDRFAIQLQTERTQAADAVAQATSSYISASQLPAPQGWSDRPYTDGHAPWEMVVEQVTDAQREVDEVNDVILGLQQTMALSEQHRAAFDTARQTAVAAVHLRVTDGFHVSALNDELDRADVLYDQGLQAHEDRRLGESADAMAEAVALLGAVEGDADGLHARRQALLGRLGELRTRAAGAPAIVEEIGTTVASMQQVYAATVTEPVAETPAQAAEVGGAVSGHLDVAAEAVSMTAQRFEEADVALDAAEERLDGLEQLRSGVSEVRADAEQAQVQWPEVFAEATRSITQARHFASSNARDVDAVHLPALGRAEESLAEAKQLFDAARPDPLGAIRRLQEVDRAADAVLSRARDEKHVKDLRRRRAKSKVQSARSEVRRAHARAGYGLFGWSDRSKESLAHAERALVGAARMVEDDPVGAERIATSQERVAAKILAEARRRAENSGSSRSNVGLGGSRSSSRSSSRRRSSRRSRSSSRRGGGSSKW